MALGQLRYRSGLPVTEIRNRSGLVVWSFALGGPRWDESDLREAILDDVICEGGVIVFTTLIGASLKRADLYWLFAGGNSFAEADLEGCVLHGCNLSQADFSGARLRRTRFMKDNLLGRTNLTGANLSAAAIDEADFSGAEYDDATRFPRGFHPLKHGLTKAKS
jgi:uncharacterized protein YjbI with pentapeptide repeats